MQFIKTVKLCVCVYVCVCVASPGAFGVLGVASRTLFKDDGGEETGSSSLRSLQ